MQFSRDPIRGNVRTMHASFVIMFLAIFVIFGLGAYETLAAIVNPNASVLLPLVDDRARAAQAAAQGHPWLTVAAPTRIYSATMDPLRTAEPGERYQVVTHQDGWALAVRQNDPPERAVWIALDQRVHAPGLVPNPVVEALLAVIMIAGAMLLTLGSYSWVRHRLQERRAPAGSRRRRVPHTPPHPVPNGNGRLPTAS